LKHLFDITKNIKVNRVGNILIKDNDYSLDIARFDLLHPVISGNKFFKLKYNIEEAIRQHKKGVLTMGGAYSNYLIATACYAKKYGLNSKAIVRGPIHNPLNHTLEYCVQYGMELIPIERSLFDERQPEVQKIISEQRDYLFIPYGGSNEEGIKGAAEMTAMIPAFDTYDMICCSIGSGTMFKGLSKTLSANQTIIGIPAIKIKTEEQDAYQKDFEIENKRIKIYFNYAGKGFGKPDNHILTFMNELYRAYQLPTDFVYTGKLCYAIMDLMNKGQIEKHQKVLIIHSGGLQGNLSLKEGTLIY
jgi:D-cysteine desulfhydrase